MSPADRIAIACKSNPGHKLCTGILVGLEEFKTIVSNTEPCNPPDYVPNPSPNLTEPVGTFCGKPLLVSPGESHRLAFIIDITLGGTFRTRVSEQERKDHRQRMSRIEGGE